VARLAATFALAFLPSLMTEVLTNNIPPSRYVRPGNLLFMVVVYGLPVLCIHDAIIMLRLGLSGTFALGLAYGVLNEGIMSKTLLMGEGVPIEAFAPYLTGGVNLPWAVLIVVFHALHAVLYPLVVVRCALGAAADRTLLGRRSCRAAVLVVAIVALLMYQGGPLPHLILFTILIGVLICSAGMLPRRPPLAPVGGNASGLRMAAAGFAVYVLWVVGLALLATVGFPGAVIVAVAVALLCLCAAVIASGRLYTRRSLLLLSLGDCLGAACFLFLWSHAEVPWGQGAVSALAQAAVYGLALTVVWRRTD
jgi:hypothetical protein